MERVEGVGALLRRVPRDRPLLLATRNRKKLRELGEILEGLDIPWEGLDAHPEAPEVEEVGTTFEENAGLKAAQVARALGRWVLADDSGLEVDVLGGAPGVYSARYAGAEAGDEANRRKLQAALAGQPRASRAARFVCVIAISDPEGRGALFRGTCEGWIGEREAGSGGFGYDPLFRVGSGERTMAELSASEKHAVSHRGEALRALVRAWGAVQKGG